MGNVSIWDDFTNMYSLQKTLRFELKPFGRTSEYISVRKLIEKDGQKAQDFLKVKQIMNDYCRILINDHLSNINLDVQELYVFKEKFLELKKDKNNLNFKKDYLKSINDLGKKLYTQAKFDEIKFDDKHFIEDLKIWLEKNNKNADLELVKSFDGFSSYFAGFFKNRENIFKISNNDAEEVISTSIVYRTINENLVYFLDNCLKFEELIKFGIDFSEIENNFKEELENKKLDKFIKLENYNSFLTQEGIDKLNLIIGGQTLENGTKLKGINEIINLYSQKINDKNIRRKKLKMLDKQILSKSNKVSFIPMQLKDDKEFIDLVKCADKRDSFKQIKNLFDDLLNYDLDLIWIKNDELLKKISHELFSDWEKLKKLIVEYKFGNKTDKQKENEFKKQDYFSIKEIEYSILNAKIFDSEDDKKRFYEKINNNFKHPLVGFFQRFDYNNKNLLDELESSYNVVKDVLNKQYSVGTKDFLHQSNEFEVEKIKIFLDNCSEIVRFVKLLNYKKGKADDYATLDVDTDFYDGFNNVSEKIKGYFDIFNELKELTRIYDKARNYVSQKPFSTDKFKLNFDNSTLASGWDKNKESDNYTIILRKDNNYYLGIMTKENNNLFKIIPKNETNNVYKKIEYKQIALPMGLGGFVRKCTNTAKKYGWECPESCQNTDGDIIIKEDEINKNLSELIDCYKNFLNLYEKDGFKYKDFGFLFRDSNDYIKLNDFFQDVERQGYKLSFTNIDSSVIDQYVNEGKLYLFQIYNKDFSSCSKGNKNLHTLYWNALFSEENLKDVVFKLNGGAELFYREKSIPDRITHPKGNPIDNKDIRDGKKTSIFNYDLIKDRRYTEDKFFFYCPITINFKASGNEKVLNKKVVEKLKERNAQVNILGFDRGERNLVYFSLINQSGEIEKQGSFNIIYDKFGRGVNYHNKLADKEDKRDDARKNWKKIENIKELKQGYLSLVVHEISKLAINNNAIIVFEDLNFGFKRGRFKIEKQIYQKLEKMLIEKLNYLMFKDKSEINNGGLMKAYQLTSKFVSFKKIGKQTGIIFYVPASYTSKIDPKTGFVNLLYPKYENEDQVKGFLSKFKYIKYNKVEDLFEFNFNYSDFKAEENKIKLIRDNWSIWSNSSRLVTKRDSIKNNNWITCEFNLTSELKALFDSNNIKYLDGKDVLENIVKINNPKFFKDLIYILKYLLQLRNSYTESEIETKFKNLSDFRESNYDYILSCVKDKNGNFFDSRIAKDNEPKDADANGAYNIALKGLILINKIQANNDLKQNLNIKLDEFLNYVIVRNK